MGLDKFKNLEFKDWVVMLPLILILITIVLAISGGMFFLVWNYLVLWLIPHLPYLTFLQSVVASIVLSFFGSFFRNIKSK
jgi:hypothetical protein